MNGRKHIVGEYVMYKSGEICRIEDIRTEDFAGMGEKEYYVLRQNGEMNSVMYIPVNGRDESAMRHVLNAEEIDAVIDDNGEYSELWIDDLKSRVTAFEQILRNGDRAEILWIIKRLSAYRDEAAKNKKKLYAGDERVLASAERIITGEFSFVLGINREDVMPYILKRAGIGDEAAES